jgi:YjbR
VSPGPRPTTSISSDPEAVQDRRVSTKHRSGTNPAELRDRCLSLPGAEETFPFGPKTSVFKVAGRMFALSQLGAASLRVSLKCEPQLAEALRGAYAAVFPDTTSTSATGTP